MTDGTPLEAGREAVHAQADAAPLLARPAVIGPFGKLDAEIKTVVDIETLEKGDRKAHAGGSTRSEILRELYYLYVHGKSFNALQAEAADRRMRLMMGEGLELAQEVGRLSEGRAE